MAFRRACPDTPTTPTHAAKLSPRVLAGWLCEQREQQQQQQSAWRADALPCPVTCEQSDTSMLEPKAYARLKQVLCLVRGHTFWPRSSLERQHSDIFTQHNTGLSPRDCGHLACSLSSSQHMARRIAFREPRAVEPNPAKTYSCQGTQLAATILLIWKLILDYDHLYSATSLRLHAQGENTSPASVSERCRIR